MGVYDNNRSDPWSDTEFLRYGPHKLVYTNRGGEGVIVRFPGGAAMPLNGLRNRSRHPVIEPRVWRK